MAAPTDGRPNLRRIAALAFFGALSAAFAPAAQAAPLTLHAVNTRGVEQASLVTYSPGTTFTDANGRVTLDVQPGETVRVTRGSLAPEGAGVPYTVPNPVPAAPVTVTLQALAATVAPGIDSAEAWLVKQINAERAAIGRAPLTQSSTLSRAADAYAHYLESTGQFSHLALADPGVRAVDQGWPVPGGSSVGEALALAPSKELALDGWRNSAPHWQLLMMDGLDSVGVGRAGSRWIMMAAVCGMASSTARCGLNADPAARPPGTGSPAPPAAPDPVAAERKPRLAVRLRRKGRRLVVRVRVVLGDGQLKVAARKGSRRAKLRHHRKGDLHRYLARLPRRGRWKVIVRFDGAPGWGDRRLVRRP
jgi:uncharacterized protein YkwD